MPEVGGIAGSNPRRIQWLGAKPFGWIPEGCGSLSFVTRLYNDRRSGGDDNPGVPRGSNLTRER